MSDLGGGGRGLVLFWLVWDTYPPCSPGAWRRYRTSSPKAVSDLSLSQVLWLGGGGGVLAHLVYLSTMFTRNLEKVQDYIRQLWVTLASPSKVLRCVCVYQLCTVMQSNKSRAITYNIQSADAFSSSSYSQTLVTSFAFALMARVWLLWPSGHVSCGCRETRFPEHQNYQAAVLKLAALQASAGNTDGKRILCQLAH